jgi:hypothetical protein
MRRVLIALLAAAATVIASAVPAAAAIPRDARWKSSAAMASWNNGGYLVDNNEWNQSAGPQTVWADSYQHWGVQSTQQAGNTAVETYPCVQKNFNNLPVRSFHLIQIGFRESMPANTAGLAAEAADDVWLNNYSIELMIWVDNIGQQIDDQVIGHATIFGQHYVVYKNGSEYIFALQRNETTGVTHILASILWLTHHGYVKAGATLRTADFGWEISSTDGTPKDFTVTRYWLHTQRY